MVYSIIGIPIIANYYYNSLLDLFSFQFPKNLLYYLHNLLIFIYPFDFITITS